MTVVGGAKGVANFPIVPAIISLDVVLRKLVFV